MGHSLNCRFVHGITSEHLYIKISAWWTSPSGTQGAAPGLPQNRPWTRNRQLTDTNINLCDIHGTTRQTNVHQLNSNHINELAGFIDFVKWMSIWIFDCVIQRTFYTIDLVAHCHILFAAHRRIARVCPLEWSLCDKSTRIEARVIKSSVGL